MTIVVLVARMQMVRVQVGPVDLVLVVRDSIRRRVVMVLVIVVLAQVAQVIVRRRLLVDRAVLEAQVVMASDRAWGRIVVPVDLVVQA